jgi:hypothetical protein
VIEFATFYGDGFRKVWTRLRLRGVGQAARRLRRRMREHGLSATNRPPQLPANGHDGRITTGRVTTTWSTDMPQAVLTSGGGPGARLRHGRPLQLRVHRAARRYRCQLVGALEPVRQGGAARTLDRRVPTSPRA